MPEILGKFNVTAAIDAANRVVNSSLIDFDMNFSCKNLTTIGHEMGLF